MSPRNRLAVAILLGTLVLAIALLVTFGGTGGGASTLSRNAEGWLLARSYLEERPGGPGSGAVVWDRPLEDLPPEARTLVLSLPGIGLLSMEDRQAVEGFLAGGGSVLVAYSGEHTQRGEELALEFLDLGRQSAREEPPLSYGGWKSHRQATWTLKPGDLWRKGTFSTAPPTPKFQPEIRAVDWVPSAPRGAEVVFSGGERDLPVVYRGRRSGGTLWVLPARLFANGHLHRGGNVDLLEALARHLEGPWYFDEFHHGFLAADAAPDDAPERLFQLLLVHLALLYLLTLWRLGRRFGSAWRPAARVVGSTGTFLKGLGALHHRLGHHRRAAALLVERAEALDPRRPMPESIHRDAAQADAGTFHTLAVAVATHQPYGNDPQDKETRP